MLHLLTVHLDVITICYDNSLLSGLISNVLEFMQNYVRRYCGWIFQFPLMSNIHYDDY
jgi:hypothetical protein